jgi:hypothetical protein
MLQNVIHVLTMHPLPHALKEHVIIMIKSMQVQAKKISTVTSYSLVFSCGAKIIYRSTHIIKEK